MVSTEWNPKRVVLKSFGYGGGGDTSRFDILDRQLRRGISEALEARDFGKSLIFSLAYYQDGPIKQWGLTGLGDIRFYRKQSRIVAKVGFPLCALTNSDAKSKLMLVDVVGDALHAMANKVSQFEPAFHWGEFLRQVDGAITSFLADESTLFHGDEGSDLHRKLRKYLDARAQAIILGEPIPPELNVGHGYELVADPLDGERVIWRKLDLRD